MDPTPLTLELRPLHHGAYSQITLKGPVAKVPRALQVRRLMSVLWLWRGSPVDVVLCVDGTNTGACWLEVWEDVLGRVPSHHLNLRYLISRNTLAQGSPSAQRPSSSRGKATSRAVSEHHQPVREGTLSPALSPRSRQMPYATLAPTGSAKIRLRATGWVPGPGDSGESGTLAGRWRRSELRWNKECTWRG